MNHSELRGTFSNDENVERLFASMKQSLQNHLFENLDAFKQDVLAMVVSKPLTPPVSDKNRIGHPIAVANGKTIRSMEEIQSLDYNTFDVVLNTIEGKLMARGNPATVLPPKECPLIHIGATRLTLLRFMLEHPHFPVCEETWDRIFEDSTGITRNTLASYIRCIRKILQGGNAKGPYLLTDRITGGEISATNSVYKMNAHHKYLVIRYS